MSAAKNIALVDCSVSKQDLQLNYLQRICGYNYNLKKVLHTAQEPAGFLVAQYPEMEVVQDKAAIIDDQSIDLVIVSAPQKNDLQLVGALLRSGKQIRIL
ncbi:hypothetical protein V9K67_04310 [Paraflavisolibacter sp. H34]|uniref:hypothetical protein n=1 Tax=Huijunlia imazamoxiresistens TaxID=3127457 RepID=UPI0030158F10